MSSVVIAGAQWGDEGKGKVVDVLAQKVRIVARYQGGHNAGHTVVIDGKQYILHLVPSGILHEGKVAVVGNGTVVEPKSLIIELDELEANGIKVTKDNFLISSGAHLIMPYHMALDGASEKVLGKAKIGTTGRGIGPAYTDKVSRRGLMVGDLVYPEIFREKLENTLGYINALLTKVYEAEPFDVDTVYDEFMQYAKRLAPHITDTELVVNDALDKGEHILFEGAQGALLDIDHGTYPFVTSSSATAGGVCTGLGIGPTRVDKVIGIVKAYTTRVGEGPFPTELFDETGEYLQKNGGEFGATTGRPRRCGWLDIVALKHSVRVNGYTGVVITKLDVLSGLDELKICTAYDNEGTRTENFPNEAVELAKCKPMYEVTMPGWSEITRGVKQYDVLPDEAKAYLKRVEELIGVPIDVISTGPARDEIIIVNEAFE